MTHGNRVVALLRLFLVLLFGVLLLFQTVSFPGQFRHMAEQDPDSAHLRWPLTAIAVVLLLCVQVVVVATWRLLTLVASDRIFSDAAFVWVDAIVHAVGAAWLVLAGVGVGVGLRADDPSGPLILFLLLVGVAVAGLLMVVMRALLRQATALRTDLEGVV